MSSCRDLGGAVPPKLAARQRGAHLPAGYHASMTRDATYDWSLESLSLRPRCALNPHAAAIAPETTSVIPACSAKPGFRQAPFAAGPTSVTPTYTIHGTSTGVIRRHR